MTAPHTPFPALQEQGSSSPLMIFPNPQAPLTPETKPNNLPSFNSEYIQRMEFLGAMEYYAGSVSNAISHATEYEGHSLPNSSASLDQRLDTDKGP